MTADRTAPRHQPGARVGRDRHTRWSLVTLASGLVLATTLTVMSPAPASSLPLSGLVAEQQDQTSATTTVGSTSVPVVEEELGSSEAENRKVWAVVAGLVAVAVALSVLTIRYWSQTRQVQTGVGHRRAEVRRSSGGRRERGGMVAQHDTPNRLGTSLDQPETGASGVDDQSELEPESEPTGTPIVEPSASETPEPRKPAADLEPPRPEPEPEPLPELLEAFPEPEPLPELLEAFPEPEPMDARLIEVSPPEPELVAAPPTHLLDEAAEPVDALTAAVPESEPVEDPDLVLDLDRLFGDR